jgi:hypothetical protein
MASTSLEWAALSTEMEREFRTSMASVADD